MAAECQPKHLRIGIVGGGIAGLAAAVALRSHGHGGHQITIFERHPEGLAIGGPVNLHPNATRILIGFGVGDAIKARAPELRSAFTVYRYADGTVLRDIPHEDMESAFGSPSWNLSRHALTRILLDRARSLGVAVVFGKEIMRVDIDGEEPSILTKDGETYTCDLVIAADGIQSSIREVLLQKDIRSSCPVTAYSINISRDVLAADPELEFLVNNNGGWFGPGRYVNTMDMADFNNCCNFCFTSENDEGREGEWFTKGDIGTVQARFSDFDPRLHKVLALADPDACYIWRLSDIPPLERWHNGRVVLVGDAAHAVLPYTGMGAACGIEDSLCLAECLSQITNVSTDLPLALAAFEAIRKPRVRFIAEQGRHTMHLAHLPDGPQQAERDAIFRLPANPAPVGSEGKLLREALRSFDPPSLDAGSSFMAHTRRYLMGYNVLAHTREYLKRDS